VTIKEINKQKSNILQDNLNSIISIVKSWMILIQSHFRWLTHLWN